MSDTTDAAVAEELVERLTKDAIRCSGAEKCVMPLMYCSFGPADRCDEIAALWLHVIAERDALRAEHEKWRRWLHDDSGDKLKELLFGNVAVEAHDHAEKVIRGG